MKGEAKNYKLFQISYSSNFAFCICLVGFTSFRFGTYKTTNNLNLFLTFLILITLVFAIFDWLCYQLLQSLKARRLLSKKLNIAGLIINIICISLTLFFIFEFIRLIKNILWHPQFYYSDLNFIFTIVLLLGITLTSIYLSFFYWVLRKKLSAIFINSIENFGEE